MRQKWTAYREFECINIKLEDLDGLIHILLGRALVQQVEGVGDGREERKERRSRKITNIFLKMKENGGKYFDQFEKILPKFIFKYIIQDDQQSL